VLLVEVGRDEYLPMGRHARVSIGLADARDGRKFISLASTSVASTSAANGSSNACGTAIIDYGLNSRRLRSC
jgi:hypothetical protein